MKLRTLHDAPPLPTVDDIPEPSGALEPIATRPHADDRDSHAPGPQTSSSQSNEHRSRNRKRRVRRILRGVGIASALTLVFAAGITAASYLVKRVTTQMQGAGPAEPVRFPNQTETILVTAAGLAVTVLAVKYAALFYSKRKYPHFLCLECKGSGKDFEPRWLMRARWGRRRGWRMCPKCGGDPTENR